MKQRAYELRNKTGKEMLKELEELRQELSQLQVAKATGAAASKLAKIKIIRKNIARVLTVYNQKIRSEAREKYSKSKYGCNVELTRTTQSHAFRFRFL